jgi:P4 family phage/plasmid primase-like protien
MDDTARYFQACFGNTAGSLTVAIGHEPYISDTGKYSHKRWVEHAAPWPKRAEDAVAAVLRQAPNADVYCCPYLMRDRHRAKGNAASRVLVHADVDGRLDLDVVRELGGFAVASGTPGHAHVYIPLSYAVTAAQHEMLCRGLAEHLGGDAKYSDNDLLRPPGTLNHKPVAVGGEPAVVDWLVPWDGTRRDPRMLAVQLGVDIANAERTPPAEGSGGDYAALEFALDDYRVVADALAENSGDRSADTMRVAAVCFDAGLSLAQTRWALRTRTDLAARLDEFAARRRPVDDAQNCWDKAAEGAVLLVGAPTVDAIATNCQPTPTDRQAPDEPQNATATPPPAPRHLVPSDTSNAVILAACHADRLRYIPELGAWVGWDATRWRLEPDAGVADTAARHVAAALPTTTKEQIRHRKHSLSVSGITGMVRLARSDPALRVPRNRLDANAYELNTPNGTVNLHTGTLHDHDPVAWHTRSTSVPYNPDANCPTWKAFLNTAFNDDADLVTYMQRLAGCAAIGEVTHHVLPFLHGAGQNGKTVFLETLSCVLGDYAATAPANFLLRGRDRHETEIARLAGVRFVVCSEINQGSRFDEAKVKLLTGGDTLTGRFMHRNFFDFRPSHTLFLMGNHRPSVSAGGYAFWRRLRLIPFEHTVADEDRIDNLHAVMAEAEGPAILAWIVRGAVDVANWGLEEPAAVTEATREYAESEDTVQRFIDEETLPAHDDDKEPSADVYRRYAEWCHDNGIPAKDSGWFGRELSTRGLRISRTHGRRYVYGIALPTLGPDQAEQ